MKPMRILVLLALASSAGTALGQGELGPLRGTVTAGYRFTDVSGREEKYAEFFNLRQGFRVHDLSLYSSDEVKNSYFDSFFLSASGMGGEPFSGGQFTVRKNHVYDLRLNFQQSYYYWDRNDNQANPNGLDGFTSNHDWSTVRKIGSVNFSTYATNKLRFTGEYQHSGRHGPTTTTRTLEYAPDYDYVSWGSFQRANPYVVTAPLDQDSHRLMGGINYSAPTWSFFYRAGYQWFNEDLSMENLGPGQRSINIDDARTALELLDSASWNESRRRRAPVSEFSFNGNPAKGLRLRGGYFVQRFRGPHSMDGSFSGTARSGSTELPYSITFHNDSNSREINHVADLGLSYDIAPTVLGHVDYRYYRYNVSSDLSFQSDAATPPTGEESTEWRNGTHTLDLALEFNPAPRLQIRPGIRYTKRDVTLRLEGVEEEKALERIERADKRSKIVSPMLTVYYAPAKNLTLRGDIGSATNGGPYARISPRKDLKIRWVGQYRLGEKFTIANTMNVRTASFSTTDYRNAIRSNATNLTYAVNNRLSLLGGFIYDSFFATAFIHFDRGVDPKDAVWQDQSINRVWQAGIEAKPTRKLSLNLTGNYIRNTGVGEISGEPPTFGPLTWPLVTGTASYEVPHGRVSIDLQRTYYIEEILNGDNFGASLFAIRWTTEF